MVIQTGALITCKWPHCLICKQWPKLVQNRSPGNMLRCARYAQKSREQKISCTKSKRIFMLFCLHLNRKGMAAH